MNASTPKPITIIGIEASPYSVKLRAYCRYRHIPYRWLSRMPQFFAQTANVKPLIMPVVQFDDGSYQTDSTPIILKLENAAPSNRTVLLNDPALNFVNLLIEDFADEWLAKCIFHYRFAYDADREFGPRWVMDDAFPGANTEQLHEKHEMFLARQTERMPLVGCTPANAELIEMTYEKVLTILNSHVALEKFLFGSAPSFADFGLYGPLHTLGLDPTPQQIMREKAPRVDNWVRRLGDLSGLNGNFVEFEKLPRALFELVALIQQLYLPYLEANAKAIDAGESEFAVRLLDSEYSQSAFKYQAKCLQKLRETYDSLGDIDKRRLESEFQLTL
ncbi:MAG: glutathione S-transferase N-terminal domain-containing protein [Pseudomonadota bacterium]